MVFNAISGGNMFIINLASVMDGVVSIFASLIGG